MSRFPFIGIRNRDRLEIITELMVSDKVFRLRNNVINFCYFTEEGTLFHFQNDLVSLLEDNVSDVIDRSVMDRF